MTQTELLEKMEAEYLSDYFEAECTECGHSQQVEPDANYPCPECGRGRLQSSMVKLGII